MNATNANNANMQINIESLKKKETANSINFDYEINDLENLDDFSVKTVKPAKNNMKDYQSLLGAEKIDFIKIQGNISQKNALVAIDYDIEAVFWAECARCNKETPHTIKVCGEKYIADKYEEKNDDGDFYITETDGIIDLSDFLVEFLGLEIPFRYLCSDDCKGLCPKCGKDLNEGDCSCQKREKNPAFAVLDDFFRDN